MTHILLINNLVEIERRLELEAERRPSLQVQPPVNYLAAVKPMGKPGKSRLARFFQRRAPVQPACCPQELRQDAQTV
jgi:hypothetical protein